MSSAKKCVIVIIGSLLLCGCAQQKIELPGANAAKQFEVYGPQKIDIVGLSELRAGGVEGPARLKVFVRVLDEFGSAIKTPCVFRVELYDHEGHSPTQTGKRLEIWPDIDLIDSCKNQGQWRDYLRAYEFNLDISSKLVPDRVYIVEITCQSFMGKRISARYNISLQK